MSSPGLSGLKSKKKYSGALFLENDEFDCFAEEARDESSEDGKPQAMDILKSMGRKESGHIGLSAGSRKFSKKIEEVENEDQEHEPVKAPQLMLPQHKVAGSEQKQYGGYAGSNTQQNYSEIEKGFLPTSANKIGMNSIPTIPFMNQSSNTPASRGSFSQGQGFSPDLSSMYQNMSHGDEEYGLDDASIINGLSDHQIMQHLQEFLANQADHKLLQSRAENRPSFFDLVFKHISHCFADYCIDPTTTVFAISIMDLALLEHSKIKRLIGSFKGRVIQLCSDPYGTRIMQRLIEKTYNKPDLFEPVVSEMQGGICMLVMCNNGNHVVQKLISQAKCPQIPWVYDEILERFKALGMHKHGCCVIQRCIDHANNFYKVPSDDPGQDRGRHRPARPPVRRRHVRQLRGAVHHREALPP